MAEAQADDHFPSTGPQRVGATFVKAVAQVGQPERRRPLNDILNIAQRMIAGDSYAWPRLE